MRPSREMIQAEEKTAPVAAAMEKAPSTNESPEIEKNFDVNNFDDLVEYAEIVKANREQPLSEELDDFAYELAKILWNVPLTHMNQVADFFELQMEINGGEYPLERFVYEVLRVWHTDLQLLNDRGHEPEVEEAIKPFRIEGKGSILHQIEICRGFDLKKFMTQWFLSHKADSITLKFTRMYALFMAQRPAWV